MTGYMEKLQEMFIEAMFKVGIEAGRGQIDATGKRVAMLDSAAIAEACVNIIAFVVHTSQAVSTPTKTRMFCDDLARKMQRRIIAAQRSGAAVTHGINTINVQDVQ